MIIHFFRLPDPKNYWWAPLNTLCGAVVGILGLVAIIICLAVGYTTDSHEWVLYGKITFLTTVLLTFFMIQPGLIAWTGFVLIPGAIAVYGITIDVYFWHEWWFWFLVAVWFVAAGFGLKLLEKRYDKRKWTKEDFEKAQKKAWRW